MKILQINKYHYIKGGAETVFFNTTNLLKENGHDVSCFCLKNKNNIPSKDESYFVDYPEIADAKLIQKLINLPSFFYNKQAAHKLEQLIFDKKPDIAHIHLLFNSLSVAILPILKKYHIPTVMTVHDYRLICPAYLLLDREKRICEQCKNKHYFNCALKRCHDGELLPSIMLSLDMYFRNLFFPLNDFIDKFIFVSDFAFGKHISFDAKYQEKGTRLYNFIPGKATSKPKERKGDYLLFYGRMSREKGIETLIKAMQGIDFQLKVIGTGSLAKKYKDARFQNIEFLGFKTGEELENCIKDAFYVIVPSECNETFGLTAVEPQRYGVPVIGANIGAIPELIVENKNGYLFESGNVSSLRKVIEKAIQISDSEYWQMSEYVKTFVEKNFNSDNHLQRLMGIYEECIALNQQKKNTHPF